jgi:hypothetical protein
MYRVEYRDDLGSGTWLALGGEVVGTGAELVVVDPSPALGQRFYRVRQIK